MVNVLPERNSAHCGAPFTAQRATRHFCSPGCRLTAMRQRRRELEARQVETVGAALATPQEARQSAATVAGDTAYAAARASLEATGTIDQLRKTVGADGKEAARVLDTSRDYAEIHGHPGYAFEQDGIYFRSDGTEADRGE